MTIDTLKEKVTVEYGVEIRKIFSLLPERTTDGIENKIPAICLSGDEYGLINLFLEVLLEKIEDGFGKVMHYNAICNSNDYFEIGGNETIIKIEHIRDLITFSSYKKERLRYKYIVVKNIEKANVYALNSLLKLIEEPSQNSLFICTTTAYTSLLSTIKSRLFTVRIPTRLTLSDFHEKNSEEFSWVSKSSFDIIYLSSDIEYSDQKKIMKTLREKTVRELFDEFALLCLEESSLLVAGMELQDKILRKLYSLCIVEKLLFSTSKSDFKDLILIASEFLKGMDSSSGSIFFKELFSSTEKVLYSIFKADRLSLNNQATYTYLTVKLLESDIKLDLKHLIEFLKFLEKIKNSVQINCNKELLLYNYLIEVQKILKRK